jgi:dipeptidyl-peptidase-4
LLYENKNPIEDFNIGKIELNSIEHSTDKVTLFTRTFYPPNFDATKKYPVVVYVYGGPHAQMVTNSWLGGGNLWMAYMASQGYIVFTLDNRGSSHRGFEFESSVHRQLGTLEMSDQLAGLEWLKSQSFIDSSRIGVHGWSFGGFMTTSLMTRQAGKYKVGVAGGPVIDWKYYEIMYTERYMDRPEENPEGYEANNLLNHTGKLKGRLLQIHGADDDVVVWQHSMMFVKKSVELSNPNLDYFVYPGHKHNVSGRDRIHLYKKVSQYFFDHL